VKDALTTLPLSAGFDRRPPILPQQWVTCCYAPNQRELTMFRHLASADVTPIAKVWVRIGRSHSSGPMSPRAFRLWPSSDRFDVQPCCASPQKCSQDFGGDWTAAGSEVKVAAAASSTESPSSKTEGTGVTHTVLVAPTQGVLRFGEPTVGNVFALSLAERRCYEQYPSPSRRPKATRSCTCGVADLIPLAIA
jgi:hypothetical protein